eukprot:968707-Amphidinium_carterae.1
MRVCAEKHIPSCQDKKAAILEDIKKAFEVLDKDRARRDINELTINPWLGSPVNLQTRVASELTRKH